MVGKLVRKVKEYQYYHKESPNVIYVGHNEWYELMESFSYRKDDCKFMDIPVIEVDKESYLKVGIVE